MAEWRSDPETRTLERMTREGTGRSVAMAKLDADRQPVIVGVGEIKDRPSDPMQGLEPVALIEAALRHAEADAGARLLPQLDALDIVNVVSWRYADLPGLLSRRLGVTPSWQRHGEIGGQTPVQFIHEAAQRIARGESAVAAVCGAEASNTATWARRTGATLPWTVQPEAATTAADGWLPIRNRDYLHPMARRHGLTEPITVYPLYETATQAAWGQTPTEGRTESAALWARLSEVAAHNPDAWMQRAVGADEIATVTAGNRPICWPYPKLMVANPAVNQGAAVLLTSLSVARAAGIAEDRLVHIHGGAAAAEPKDWIQRDSFVHAAGQDAVLEAMLRDVDGDASRFTALELYSCFPVVPKMARRLLGLADNVVPTMAGGLTFHGAPLNNYMTHGAAAMVRALRSGNGGLGLLYGQGGYLTWHHGLILGSEPPESDVVLRPFDLQPRADQRRSAAPRIVETAEGAATVEAFTVVFKPDAQADFGAVVLRLPDGARTLARVAADDAATLGVLMAPEQTPIGRTGHVSPGEAGLLRWEA
jgi:acetyl-CoA C-acetyltransferase